MKKHVIIEQCALISALGTLQETSQHLLKGTSALKPAPCFDIPVAHAPFKDITYRDLGTSFTHLKKELHLVSIKHERTLFIYAAAKGDIRVLEPDENKTSALNSPLLHKQAQKVVELLGIQPAGSMVISNACASGAVALSVAQSFLECECFSAAVIAGFDVISHFVTSGFHSLGALSLTGARPFDAQRDGLTLGDGAACVVLRYRQAQPGDIYIAGAAQSNDANHRTGPSRDGDGLHQAALGALTNGRSSPQHIGAIKCHGTATVFNDAMEAKAINRLFSNSPPPCFSVKGAIGHTSGAGSLIEVLLAEEFLRIKKVPPTVRFTNPDGEALLPVSSKPQPFTNSSILCLSAGFGGLNAAVFLKEWDS